MPNLQIHNIQQKIIHIQTELSGVAQMVSLETTPTLADIQGAMLVRAIEIRKKRDAGTMSQSESDELRKLHRALDFLTDDQVIETRTRDIRPDELARLPAPKMPGGTP